MGTIHTSVSAGKTPHFAVMGRKVYAQDGWRRMQVWDGLGASSVGAGIVGPDQTVGAWDPSPSSDSASPGLTAGVHLVRYRYLNSQTGYVSEPSNEYTLFVLFDGDTYTFAIDTSGSGNIIRSSDAKADRIVVEMTAVIASGDEDPTFYLAAEVPMSASSVTVSLDDVALARQTLDWGSTANVHNLPPIAQYVLYHRGRLWTFGQVVHAVGTVDVTNASDQVTGTGTDWTAALAPDVSLLGLQRTKRLFQVDGDAKAYEIESFDSSTGLTLAENYAGTTASGASYRIFSRDNDVYYSEPEFPESWPILSSIPGPEQGRLRGVIGLLNGLLIFSLTTTEYFFWTESPEADGAKKVASQERGAVGQRVLLNVEEVAYGLDRRGFWRMEGISPDAISRPIDSIVQRINWTVEEKFHGCFYPRLRAIRWWVALDSDTEPHHYLQYDIDRGSWCMGEREVAVTSSCLGPTSSGVRVLVGDENGHVWFDDEGDTDGADAAPRATAASSATTTVVPVQSTVTLPTTGTGLAGVIAWFERLDEARVVESNTASQLTLASALSEAPQHGDRIHLGRIKAKIKTKAFALGPLQGKHRGLYVHVLFRPLAEQRFARVRIYRDYSSQAMTWGRAGFARRTDGQRGAVFPEDGGTDWQIDLSTSDGVVRIPLGDTSVRVTEVELEFEESDCPVTILGVLVDGEQLEALA